MSETTGAAPAAGETAQQHVIGMYHGGSRRWWRVECSCGWADHAAHPNHASARTAADGHLRVVPAAPPAPEPPAQGDPQPAADASVDEDLLDLMPQPAERAPGTATSSAVFDYVAGAATSAGFDPDSPRTMGGLAQQPARPWWKVAPRETCPCGDGTRPGHPEGWCRPERSTDPPFRRPAERAPEGGEPQAFVSATCEGERCSICGAPAAAKVGEEIPFDHPHPYRHNLTAYVCADHFRAIMDRGGYRRAAPPAPVGQDAEDEAWLEARASAQLNHAEWLAARPHVASEPGFYRAEATRYRRILARLRAARGAGQAPAEHAVYSPGVTRMLDDWRRQSAEEAATDDYSRGMADGRKACALEAASVLLPAAPAGEQGEAMAVDRDELVNVLENLASDARQTSPDSYWVERAFALAAALRTPAPATDAQAGEPYPAPAPAEGALREALARLADKWEQEGEAWRGSGMRAMLREHATTLRFYVTADQEALRALTPEAPR